MPERIDKPVSLTSHLDDKTSPIGQFIRQRFSQTGALTKDANRQLKDTPTLRPVVQAGEQYPYGTLGAAIDYRVRYAFAITPFHEFVAWHGAVLLTRSGAYSRGLVQAFFEQLDTTVKALQPVGRLLATTDEQTLDRFCIVLSLFEQVFRSNAYVRGPLMLPVVKHSIEELLAIPQAVELDDLSAMFALFYDRCHDLLSHSRVLNPTFAGSLDVGGADADFIVDGCLIDMKATISPQIKADFLYQLAGYVLLDYNDTYHINSVGIYMARQRMLFSWPIAEFVYKLTGTDPASLGALRQEFRTLCQKTRRAY